MRLEDTDIYVEESGLGKPLLMIHGNGCTADTWKGVAGSLSKNFRFIAYDRRGYHRSPGPLPDKKNYFRKHGEDAAEILKKLNASPANVVGWSGGGLTALHLALNNPDLIAHLILVEPPFHLKRHMTPFLVKTALRIKFWQLLGQPRRSALSFYRFATSYKTGGCAFDLLDSQAQDLMLKMATNTVTEFDAGTGEEISLEQVRSIKCPVTFLLGELTPSTIASATKRLLKALPDAHLIKIPKAAHLMHVDQPEKFTSAIQGVLGV